MLAIPLRWWGFMKNLATPAFAIFDDYRPNVTVAVVVRWVLLGTWLFVLHYRTEQDTTWVALNGIAAGLVALNAYASWRIVTGRSITWLFAFALGVADLTVITAALFITEGFQNPYFVFYYPALLGLSIMSPARLAFAVALVVIGLYFLMALVVSPTLINAMEQEKWLVVRTLTMAGMVVAGTLIVRWERSRRREAVAAERLKSEENLELQKKAQQAEMAALEERSRISREIHDGIAQSIYMLSLNLETSAELARKKPVNFEDRLKKLVGLSKETLLEVRHYIFDLKPYLAGEKGVASMVENQIREFNTIAGVPTDLEIKGDEHQVPTPVATCLYRVTQEALSNALKHSQASKVRVLLEFEPEVVQLLVQDDGQGFDSNGNHSGHGLNNMRQRAEELGGTYDLTSTPGNGTQVTVRLSC